MATHFRTPAGVPAASPQHPVADPQASLSGCELFAHVREHRHAMGEAQRRAAWAVNHCRTAEMGGQLHARGSCGKREFHFHSCNHRSCPQCGKQATADWVECQLGKRVGAPNFMVTF